MICIFLILLALFQAVMVDYLHSSPASYQLDAGTWESDEFRAMELGEYVASQEHLDMEVLAALMAEHGYDLSQAESLDCDVRALMAAKPAEFEKLQAAYETIFGDLSYFPIPQNEAPGEPDVSYEDGWGTAEPTAGRGSTRAATSWGMSAPGAFTRW